ncbi:deleted in malignant brain tumors 1 protein isoform X2 [Synchiropus splendidus]|uniref:deleted in malignant brain tumors 1 protein isoform X2 n=1 Tax=Synchiropus splendidus TaxID=270530 RepID=UPI00237E0CBB|nr:deleted in malignant brain tumors 1 protein isoform X2 [Synchiropus splendidus]
MSFLLLLLFIPRPEAAVLSGDNWVILEGGKDPCEGFVKVFHHNEWGYVGDKFWSRSTEEVVCRSTLCGQPVENATVDEFLPAGAVVRLNEVECVGSEADLLQCKKPGWNISKYRKKTVKKMKCSEKIKLELEGFTCAGAVKYSGKDASGYFCSDNWGEFPANLLCEELNCGNYKEIPKTTWMVLKGFASARKMSLKCHGTEKNLWQCAEKEKPRCTTPALVICAAHKRMQLRGNTSNVCSGRLEEEDRNSKWKALPFNRTTPELGKWCQEMNCGGLSPSMDGNRTHLTCADQIQLELSNEDPNDKCYGEVRVSSQVNGNTLPVCASNWKTENSQLVCRELGCGTVVLKRDKVGRNVGGILDNVRCTGEESSLWHCMADRADKPFLCRDTPYVVCSKSVDVRLVDSPSRCAGRVEIKYEGKWRAVSTAAWKTTNNDKVCNFLRCGNAMKAPSPEIFGQDSAYFMENEVTCSEDAQHISQCIQQKPYKLEKDPKAVGITCEGHRIYFVKGSQSCAGLVGIEQNKKTFWLSGSNTTWTADVAEKTCEQMHCGHVDNRHPVPRHESDSDAEVVSDGCMNPSTSLFECEKATLPPDHNDTIAHVRCSDRIVVNLTDGCWGQVSVCINGKCGGVWSKTWTPLKSEMLCKILGCGERTLDPLKLPTRGVLAYQSVHVSSVTGVFDRLNFINYKPHGRTMDAPAYVVCSGSVKPKLFSQDKCRGNLKVRYDGQWLPVCKDALKSQDTQDAICGELGCGGRLKVLDHFSLKSKDSQVIWDISCAGNAKALSTCTISKDQRSCDVAAIQCSNWGKIELHKGTSEACSGAVYVTDKDNVLKPVSSHGWGDAEGQRLCADLNCEGYKSKRKVAASPSNNVRFNCSQKKPQSIWDCEQQGGSPSGEQLYITCQGPKVHLSQTCSGSVKINDDDICSTNWKPDYSHMVCQQMDCSNAIVVPNTRQGQRDRKYQHVSCGEHAERLDQCDRIKEKCDDALVNVYCAKNVKFRVTEYCGGQIEVNYQNVWEKVCSRTPLSPTHKNSLCKVIGCGANNETAERNANLPRSETSKLKTQFTCTDSHEDIHHCVAPGDCANSLPAQVICNGYKPTPAPTVRMETWKLVLIGVAVVLVVCFLVAALVLAMTGKFPSLSFKFPYSVKKKKKEKSVEESESDSGDYDNLGSKANEMVIFAHENEASNAGSATSLQYDDVADHEEIQPLTAQAKTDVPDENTSDVNPDGNREKDESSLDYDDIDGAPPVNETRAEVHTSSESKAEGTKDGAAGLAQWDDDYLVPGQE